LSELGQVVPQGVANASKLIALVEDPERTLPADAIPTLKVLVAALTQLEEEITKLDAEITRRAKENEGARRLMTEPGIGPLITTAIASLASPPDTFRRARDFAAWLGLVPRQHSTGDKQRLGATTKMGERSLRRLLVIGANSVIITPHTHASASRDGDSPVLADPLGQILEDEQIGTVTAGGVYDMRRCHKIIIERQAMPIIPVRKNSRLWKDDSPSARARSATLRATRYYSRAFWKRWTGYHARSRMKAKMGCLKSVGERIMARYLDPQQPHHTGSVSGMPRAV